MKPQLCMCCLCVDIVVVSVAKWLRHPAGNLETQVRFLVEHIFTCLLSCVDFRSQINLLYNIYIAMFFYSIEFHMDFNTGLFRRPTRSWTTHRLNSMYTVASLGFIYISSVIVTRFKLEKQ